MLWGETEAKKTEYIGLFCALCHQSSSVLAVGPCFPKLLLCSFVFLVCVWLVGWLFFRGGEKEEGYVCGFFVCFVWCCFALFCWELICRLKLFLLHFPSLARFSSIQGFGFPDSISALRQCLYIHPRLSDPASNFCVLPFHAWVQSAISCPYRPPAALAWLHGLWDGWSLSLEKVIHEYHPDFLDPFLFRVVSTGFFQADCWKDQSLLLKPGE